MRMWHLLLDFKKKEDFFLVWFWYDEAGNCYDDASYTYTRFLFFIYSFQQFNVFIIERTEVKVRIECFV